MRPKGISNPQFAGLLSRYREIPERGFRGVWEKNSRRLKMKTWWGIAFGVLCGLFGAGILLLASRQPRGEPIQLRPPPTPPPVIVHVTGAVAQPGVYTLASESRVEDAVQAAGGVSPQADVQSLNLAAFIKDGERIWIPYQAQAEELPQSPGATPASVGEPGERLPVGSPTLLVDINRASQEELESLPGIGPVTAQKIIADREENGPFSKIEEIERVPGIGPAKFEKIKALITVGSGP
jgi:competence protein ComEA